MLPFTLLFAAGVMLAVVTDIPSIYMILGMPGFQPDMYGKAEQWV